MSGYRPGPRFGFLGLLVGLLIIGAVAVAAYNVGLSAAGVNGSAAAAPVYGPWFGLGFGFFQFFGFIFFILILVFLLRAIFRPWGWGHHGWRGGYWGGYGPGGWGSRGTDSGSAPQDVPPPFEPMLESWHRRAHGETPPAGDATRPPDQPS